MPFGRDDHRQADADSRPTSFNDLAARDATRTSRSPTDPTSDIGRVRVRTLIAIRWIIIALQSAAVLIAGPVLGLPLSYAPLATVIAASIVINLVATRQRRARIRLTDRDTTAYLAYDILQMSLVLWLTGGVQNPFVVLLLVPVAVAASILPKINVGLLVGWVLLLIAALLLTHEPLPVSDPGMVVGMGYTVGILTAVSLTAVGIAIYVWRVAHENRRLADAFLESQIALARAKQASALGALAAASAHEMGTPLATIALVAREIERDLPGDSPLREDVELILTQADRCRESLAALAREPETSGGDPYERLTLSQLIEEITHPSHSDAADGVDVEITADSLDGSKEPTVGRSPELMHGLGNLTQNAVSFAASRMEVVATWSARQVTVEVVDDGPGFSPQILASIGEPYRTTRADAAGHLGLGIFIASTLLDRTGADVTFSNRPEGGAQIVIRWNRAIFEHQR